MLMAFNAKAVIPSPLFFDFSKLGVGRITKSCPPDSNKSGILKFWFNGFVIPHPTMLGIAKPLNNKPFDVTIPLFVAKRSRLHKLKGGVILIVTILIYEIL